MSDDINKNDSEINLDLSYLTDVASGSVEFMIDMIDIFIDQTPGYIEQLGVAVREKNWNDVAGMAHKIKPTLAFMGVASARDDMEDIETSARSSTNLDAIQAKYTKLATICERLFAQLKDYRKELETKL